MKKKKNILLLPVIILSALFASGHYTNIYAEDPGKANLSAWEIWSKSVSNYDSKIRSIMDESKEIAMEQNKKLEAAMRTNDGQAGGQVIAEAGKQLDIIVKKLATVKPPAELTKYHDFIKKSYEFRKLANNAVMKNDIDAGLNYSRMSVISEKESLIEIRRVYVKHSAPDEVINAIDIMIKNYDQILN